MKAGKVWFRQQFLPEGSQTRAAADGKAEEGWQGIARQGRLFYRSLRLREKRERKGKVLSVVSACARLPVPSLRGLCSPVSGDR